MSLILVLSLGGGEPKDMSCDRQANGQTYPYL